MDLQKPAYMYDSKDAQDVANIVFYAGMSELSAYIVTLKEKIAELENDVQEAVDNQSEEHAAMQKRFEQFCAWLKQEKKDYTEQWNGEAKEMQIPFGRIAEVLNSVIIQAWEV